MGAGQLHMHLLPHQCAAYIDDRAARRAVFGHLGHPLIELQGGCVGDLQNSIVERGMGLHVTFRDAIDQVLHDGAIEAFVLLEKCRHAATLGPHHHARMRHPVAALRHGQKQQLQRCFECLVGKQRHLRAIAQVRAVERCEGL